MAECRGQEIFGGGYDCVNAIFVIFIIYSILTVKHNPFVKFLLCFSLLRSDFDLSSDMDQGSEETLDLLDMTEHEIEREITEIERESERQDRSRPTLRRYNARRMLGCDIRNFLTVRPRKLIML